VARDSDQWSTADRATSLLQTMTISDPSLSAGTVPSPPLSAPLIRMSISEGTAIPSSLIMALDAAYIFHLLVQHPNQVVAPGKSLLSVLAGLNQMATHTPESAPEKFVRKKAHQAFWDQVSTHLHALLSCSCAFDVAFRQALQALSSPLPSSQISRLKGLYKDLHEALTPLFPPKHPALVVFSLPLPPTSSPLLVATTHLRDALVSLRRRCAPVRDSTIDMVLHKIDHRSSSASTGELAGLLVDSIRSTLELSIDMCNDYSNAVLATASEQELADMVAATAETQEQRLVLQLWESKETMRKAWSHWMDGFRPADPTLQPRPEQLWILKLVQSLGKPHAITSKLVGPWPPQEITNDPKDNRDPDSSPRRTPPPNMLPPQFLFSGPSLFRLQNYVQALTIAASLRSLVPTPHPITSPPPQSPASWAFTERIWALLEPEIEATNEGPSETKIINLADEVIMAHSGTLPPGVGTLDSQLEHRLRSAVDRILRTDDPVFILLQKRLLAALSIALLDAPDAERPPMMMRSGRPHHQREFSSLSPPPWAVQREVTIAAKGFEDPVIAKQCSVAVSTLRRSVEWVERVWGDTMPC